MEKVRLDVLGISYSQTQSGAYALILGEQGGKRRIPIIIGAFEAQSIAIRLEKLTPPRPLTHDLFLNAGKAFDISLREVFIYKLEEGIFYSRMLFTNGSDEHEFDTRTSDAIALALRFECPIYVSSDILESAGIIFETGQEQDEPGEQPLKTKPAPPRQRPVSEYETTEMSELKRLLEEAIHNEDYEKASVIRDEINRRKQR
jgi:bifunctional DNase/RNase